VAALLGAGARIIVCGQTAAYYDVATEDLLPGVEMALSAMTVHALLQQQGFTLNPF
jgi:intracellular sulfur oxidation DsrE/DsrF family protein